MWPDHWLWRCTVLALATAVASTASAQSGVTTGGLKGTVVDATGGVLPDSSITAVYKDTNQTTIVRADATGQYVMTGLMPGAYAFVRLDLPRNTTALSIPASALIFNQDGMRIATVNAQNRVVLKTVTVSRDLGRMVELASGLEPNDRVIESPPDGINDGDTVKVLAPAAPPPQRR